MTAMYLLVRSGGGILGSLRRLKILFPVPDNGALGGETSADSDDYESVPLIRLEHERMHSDDECESCA